MKIILNLILLWIVVGGCSLFRDTRTNDEHFDQLIEEQSDLEQSAATASISQSAGYSFRTDSNHNNYSVELWPKGAFSYSNEKGFSGEAERVRIQGASRYGSSNLMAGTRSDAKKSIQKLKLKQQKKNKMEIQSNEKWTAPSWLWDLVGCVLLLAVAAVYYKKTKRKIHL